MKVTTYASDIGTRLVQGSGFYVDGYIVTCYHVVSHAHLYIDVWPSGGGGDLHAHIVTTDPAQDLALLALDVPAGAGPSLTLGSMANQSPGEPVAAMGHPGGGSLYITPGSLVSTNAQINVRGYGVLSPMLEMKLAAIGGDSGGPVFDANGHVIGVLEDGETGVAADGGAVPVSAVRAFLSSALPSTSPSGGA